jgi:hypothetical protein
MSELERLLGEAAPEIDWPATPRLLPPAAEPQRWRRAAEVVALAALIAIAVAFAVPGARSAILRAFHLEGATVVRVGVLPPAEERPLAVGIGAPVSPGQAQQLLGVPVMLPPLAERPQLYAESAVVSALLDLNEPVLLSELQTGAGDEILQKFAGGSTGIARVRVGHAPGLWVSGAKHVYLAPSAPPRLAGNVLLWVNDGIVFRLEGRSLTEADALRLAGQITGT